MKPKDQRRLIVVSCFGRGGSSLLWRGLGSSPDCLVVHGEWHEVLFRRNRLLRLSFKLLTHIRPFREFLAAWVWKRLLASAREAMQTHPFDSADENEVYKAGDESSLILCVKLMGKDIFLLDFIREQFDCLHVVCLVRDGRALIEGWHRRGMPINKGADRYVRVCNEMISQSERNDVRLLRFEDLVDNFPAVIFDLLEELDLRVRRDRKVLFKIKEAARVRSEFVTGSTHLLSEEEANAAVDSAINASQIHRMDTNDLETFEKQAMKVLTQLGY